MRPSAMTTRTIENRSWVTRTCAGGVNISYPSPSTSARAWRTTTTTAAPSGVNCGEK